MNALQSKRKKNRSFYVAVTFKDKNTDNLQVNDITLLRRQSAVDFLLNLRSAV